MKGIPEDEIKFIHEADTEAKKKDLFSKVRNGSVRVLIGSTQKMRSWDKRSRQTYCITPFRLSVEAK